MLGNNHGESRYIGSFYDKVVEAFKIEVLKDFVQNISHDGCRLFLPNLVKSLHEHELMASTVSVPRASHCDARCKSLPKRLETGFKRICCKFRGAKI